ncbi:cell wall-binding repeat-containing protein [Desulfosporosinus sp. SYSU MS00001]|uniref:cell wall-binding repeat-containing protein n=1 Tax=Desulfosporosinus sp. SYSU MS00001 TaxID=3416284 RepID=UPI003CF5C1B6
MKKFLVFFLSVVLLLSLPTFALADNSAAGKVVRLAGETKFETAIAIANQLSTVYEVDFSKGEKFDSVVLVSGNNYPDALSGAPLAAQLKAPILLVDSTPEASAETLDYVKQHVNMSGNVYILGGTGIIPLSFTNALEDLGFSSNNIHQIGGVTKDDTSLMIAKMINNPKNEVVLVSDSNFYDALTVASACVADDAPILLVPDNLNADETAFCDSQKEVVSLGEIAPKVATSYPKALGINGHNKYDTNALWTRQFVGAPNIFIATGENYPDALAGAVLAGVTDCSPIILTTQNQLQTETEKVLNETAYYDKQSRTVENSEGQSVTIPAVNVPNIFVLGGTGVVSDNLINQIAQILNSNGYSGE